MSKLSRHYLIYTFFIMAVCWGSCVVLSMFAVYMSENAVLYVPYLLGGMSPTIASYIALRQHGKVKCFKEWLKTIFDFKHNVLSYSLLLILAMVFTIPRCMISGFEAGAPLLAIVFMVPAMLFGGGLEEAGWRCIMQPELEEKYGFTLSTVIVSVIWWVWHLPLFFIKGVAQYGTDFFAFGINVVGLSFALAAIRKNTGSVWLCVLFHCMINSLQGIYIVNENYLSNAVAAVLLIIASYGAIYLQKKKDVFC